MRALPEDDRAREPAIARPADPDLLHLAVVGDTYTVLLSGEQTAGRFAMLDMLIPPGGGPPPHRHDFEECFRVLEGSLEVRVRDLPPIPLEAGDTADIPANVPHAFRNPGQVPARLERIRVVARVPQGSRASELPEGGRVRLPGPRLDAAGAPGALGPGRRAEDVEEDVQPTRRGVARRRVAGAPVVAGVCRI